MRANGRGGSPMTVELAAQPTRHVREAIQVHLAGSRALVGGDEGGNALPQFAHATAPHTTRSSHATPPSLAWKWGRYGRVCLSCPQRPPNLPSRQSASRARLATSRAAVRPALPPPLIGPLHLSSCLRRLPFPTLDFLVPAQRSSRARPDWVFVDCWFYFCLNCFVFTRFFFLPHSDLHAG